MPENLSLDHKPSFYLAKSTGDGNMRTAIECSCKAWSGHGDGASKSLSREAAYVAHDLHVKAATSPASPVSNRYAEATATHLPTFSEPVSGDGRKVLVKVTCSCSWTGEVDQLNGKDATRMARYAHNQHVRQSARAAMTPEERATDKANTRSCLLVLAGLVVAFIAFLIFVAQLPGDDASDDEVVYDDAECSALQGSIKNEESFSPSEIQDFIQEYNANCR